MAPGRNEAFAEADVILNRLNVTLARRQGLLASLIGVSSREEIERKSSHVDSYQDEDSFSADPELLGVGGKVPDNDGFDRARTSSNHELKRQLLGKDYEKRQRSGHDSKGVQRAVSASGTTLERQGAHPQQSVKAEIDSEEDAGRSSLGKRKRYRPIQANEKPVTTEGVTVQDDRQVPKDYGDQFKSSYLPVQSAVEKPLDEERNKQTSHQRRKRKRKERLKQEKHQNLSKVI